MSFSSSGAAPRTAQCAKKWFSPATFQLRLRTVKSVSLIMGSQGFGDGVFRITLHNSLTSEPFWQGDAGVQQSGDERITWSDVHVSGAQGGAKGCVIKIKHVCVTDIVEILTAVVSLSGLKCLGVHFPPLGRLNRNFLVFHISGSYFATSGDERPLARHLFFGDFVPHQVLRSYDTSLLARFLRMHRAMMQQNTTNRNFKQDLVLKGLDLTAQSQIKPRPNARTLREQVFGLCAKEAATRVAEINFKMKIEMLRVRVNFYRDEKEKTQNSIQSTLKSISAMNVDIHERTCNLMNSFHSLSKDRLKLTGWLEKYEDNINFSRYLNETATATQLSLISTFRVLFPICNPTTKQATLKWVSVPSIEQARSNSRQEIMYGITMGWIAQLLSTFSTITDMPLRYPIRFCGSFSTITDWSQGTDEATSEFPLYTKNSDISRADYGLFLINKNLAQIRWFFGLVTSDLKPTLRNLDEIIDLGSDSVESLRSEYPATHLSPPPTTASSSMTLERRDLSSTSTSSDHEVELMVVGVIDDAPEELSKKPVAINGKVDSKDGLLVRDVQQILWGDVTDRMNALSIPTSFQRRRKHHDD